jgi:hypothetical protein
MSISENQLTGVIVIGENDIVCGRGGAALKHPGNLAYRKIVNINKTLYATCLKAEKLRISKSIVAAIREVNGRFLEREDGKISTTLDERNPDGSPVTWCDIGDRRAIEKTSQALREGQPKLLKKLQQSGQVVDLNPDPSGGYAMPMGAQPPLPTVGVPPLPQINVPVDNYNSYDQQQQQQQQGYNHSYNGSNPQFLKQDSFQMMIGETLNVNQASATNNMGNTAMPGDPFGGHTSLSQPPLKNHYASSNTNPHDSWQADPTPLPFHIHSSITMGKDESKALLQALDIDTKRSSVNSSSCLGSSASGQSYENKESGHCKPRPSVTFKRGVGRDSLMSLGSHFSELSNWDTQSLDDAMDIAEREMDLKLLGNEELDFDWGDTYYENNFGDNANNNNIESPKEEGLRRGSVGFPQGDIMMKQRGSILRRTSRYSRHGVNNFPPAALSETADPGMLFTSTFDTRPGGVNAGMDVSGLLGERRKSAVAFEIRGDQQRRQSNIRLSNMSMFSEMGQIFKRDFGSTMSIQTADIRDLIDDMEDDD